MATIHIWPEALSRSEGVVTTSATVEIPGSFKTVLRYELPEEHSSSLTALCDPFVVGAIQILMSQGLDAHVHGQVSPSLMDNLAEYVAARSLWRGDLARIAIRADLEREDVPSAPRARALLAFSGGVDSGFTAFRHSTRKVHFPREIAAGVMIRGFDIPLEEVEPFSRAVDRSRLMLSSLGLGLIPMTTNYRSAVGEKGYNLSWGSAVASCLMVLRGGHTAGLLSQSVAYDDLVELDWGCNPLTDRLLSSASFQTIPDGAECGRIEKVRTLNEWPEFRRSGRVCWQAPERDRNCCVCEKCIRTILEFRVLGLGLPPCFSQDVSVEQIMALTALTEKAMAGWYDPILRVAVERGVDEPWVRALKRRLALNRAALHSRLRHQLRRVARYSSRIRAKVGEFLSAADANRAAKGQ